jgi:hypothetical protein|uniref:Uncharacterized protein n=1 Tax=Populus alba TaxID=43335 RepID=A0A4U5Q3J4_POPAL|nr:hypothetical protein D5086_0000160560 [Populus alba]
MAIRSSGDSIYFTIKKRTHSFWKDGAKVVLLPLKEGVISMTRQTNGMQAENFLTTRKFETEARETGLGYGTKDASPYFERALLYLPRLANCLNSSLNLSQKSGQGDYRP